jgi:hypothetical protein
VIGNIILGGTLRHQARDLPEGQEGARISTTFDRTEDPLLLGGGVGFLFLTVSW